jgi:LacI family transcriptional regulator
MSKVHSKRRAPNPTIRDVAREASVSVGTVSRVTSNNPTVSVEIRERVQFAIDRLGYFPNSFAQGMHLSETKLIGCLVSDISNPLYASVLRGSEKSLSAAGYTLVIASTDGEVTREVALLQTLVHRRVDGLMCVFSDEKDSRLLTALKKIKVPLVLMEREMGIRADSISTDHARGMADAVTFLLSLGHRRIGMVTGSLRTRSGRDRVLGYRRAHQSAGVSVDERLLRTGSLTTDYAFQETLGLMRLVKPVTAVIAGGNQMLAGVLRALGSLGKIVPTDVSVVSSGDTELAELAGPSITAIRWDLTSFGRQAAELLLRRLVEPETPPQHILVPSELVVRRSCAKPPADT